jgi:hypothetical protein
MWVIGSGYGNNANPSETMELPHYVIVVLLSKSAVVPLNVRVVPVRLNKLLVFSIRLKVALSSLAIQMLMAFLLFGKCL